MDFHSRYSNSLDVRPGSSRLHEVQAHQAAPRAAVTILCLYLLFEYLRLHQILPILGKLKVQTAILAALLLIVVAETAKGGVR